MIDPKSHQLLREEIKARLTEDQSLLQKIREEVSVIKSHMRRILPRSTTSIALVATDGGNNKLKFDPFLIQLVRVVDSSNNEYCLEAITPSTDIKKLSQNQFNSDGSPRTPLGKMMDFLRVKELPQLSPMIQYQKPDKPISPSWVQVYRELIEWAVLFSVVNKNFASDTLIIFDGFLRSKVFKGTLFQELKQGFASAIERQKKENRRNIYLAGIAKHSKVLERYRLAMTIEKIMHTEYPCYVEVPRELEEKAYIWSEYARGDDNAIDGREINKFVAGKMFFVKFGSGKYDPIWSIDIFSSQASDAPNILGCMLEDAKNGFPVPYYPYCLQKAHDNAALVKFDASILQDEVINGLREVLNEHWPALDSFLLKDTDPAGARYD